jgi:hypothetical protein
MPQSPRIPFQALVFVLGDTSQRITGVAYARSSGHPLAIGQVDGQRTPAGLVFAFPGGTFEGASISDARMEGVLALTDTTLRVAITKFPTAPNSVRGTWVLTTTRINGALVDPGYLDTLTLGHSGVTRRALVKSTCALYWSGVHQVIGQRVALEGPTANSAFCVSLSPLDTLTLSGGTLRRVNASNGITLEQIYERR